MLALGLAFSAGIAQAATITVGDAIGGQVVGGEFVVGVIGTAQPNINNWPGGEPPASAIDGSTGTKYLNFAEFNTGLIVSAPSTIVTGLTFSTANDAPARDPLTFTLYGSTTALSGDGPFNISSLTLITENQSTGLETDPGRFTSSELQTFANSEIFDSYLLVFPTVRDEASANSMQISEITFDGTAVPEPGSVLLGALGAAGLLARRRRS